MKKCTRCEALKAPSEFNKMGSSRDGLQPKCRSCEKTYYSANKERIAVRVKAYALANRDRISVYSKAYFETNKEELKAYGKAWIRGAKTADPVAFMLRAARARASKSGLEFSITRADVFIPERCPVLGLELKFANDKAAPNSPSLDRRDSSLGYIPGNVQVISWRANSLKKDGTVAEIKALARWMEGV